MLKPQPSYLYRLEFAPARMAWRLDSTVTPLAELTRP
jgi:hypothetical protein